MIETFRSGGEFELPEDTISFDQQPEGILELPSSIGFGFALNNANWKILVDYKNINWEEYRLLEEMMI